DVLALDIAGFVETLPDGVKSAWSVPLSKPITGIAGCWARATSGHATAPPSSVMNDHLVSPQSLWQATKHEHDACPVRSPQANAAEVFGVEFADSPAAKHMCESSVDRQSKFPVSSRQHYCKGLERKVVRKQGKVPQTLSPR